MCEGCRKDNGLKNLYVNSFVKEIPRPEGSIYTAVHSYLSVSYDLMGSFWYFKMGNLWSLLYLVYWGIVSLLLAEKGSNKERKLTKQENEHANTEDL